MQKSDAGVGIGTLIGDRDYLAQKYKNGSCLHKTDSCFWSKLNSYSRFCNNSGGKMNPRKFLVFDFSSFSRIHHFNYQKSRNSEFQKLKKWTHKVSRISKILSFRILRNFFPFFPGMFPDFLDLIQVILSNNLKKYGLPEPKTLITHEMLSFLPLMPWNRHFISSIWRRKIQLRH